jgi:Photosynthesis system II assembly factor YCF48/Putative zinc-finger
MRDVHPDANLLAAFAEKKLQGQEREEVLAHLGECADCREVLALATPARGPAARPFSPAWRWAAGVAAAVLVATSIWGVRSILRPAQNSSARVEFALRAPLPTADAIAPRLEIAPLTSLRPASPKRELHSAMKKAAPEPETLAAAAPPEPEPAPMASATHAQSLGFSAAHASMFKRSGVTWRVNARVVERSFDGGATWQPVPIKEDAAFDVVSASGGDIWAGGARGVLFHSGDGGASWHEMKVSEGADALKGTVLTIRLLAGKVLLETDAGEQWVSRDGGISWQRL